MEHNLVNEKALRRQVISLSQANSVTPPKLSREFYVKLSKFMQSVIKTSILSKDKKARIMKRVFIPKEVIKEQKLII